MKATKRERSIIVFAIVIGVAILGYTYVFDPIQEWKQTGADLIPTREAVLERRRMLVAQRPTITAEIEKINERINAVAPRWLKGPTPPLAASELQTLIKTLAQQAGARPPRARPTPLALTVGPP